MHMDSLAFEPLPEHASKWTLHEGDCLDVLRTLPANSLDSMVTDPPAGIAFMGKDWDKDKGGRDGWVAWMTEVMTECRRVLKPGAHALVWAIPRTSHWTMTALEDAGFEVRDVVTHLFGSGFPKSMDVSKAIDKAAGAEREILSIRRDYSKETSGDDKRWEGGKLDKAAAVTAPATPDALRWQGFGTALKPACEFWVLVRKPLGERTVAANVLEYGTGGLNIDGCRIATDELTPRHNHGGRKDANVGEFGVNGVDFVATPSPLGRFPANLILDEEAAAALDEQSGISKSSNHIRHCSDTPNVAMSGRNYARESKGVQDAGGASRFFYVAKASKSDRGEGNTHPTVKSRKLMTYLCRLVTPPGGTVLDPFTGSGSTGVAALAEGFQFVGIEQEAEYAGIARKRLEGAE